MVRRGFTLIEMLVVIAIIVVLAALLFPVIGRARKAGRKSSCLSNLNQVGGAIGLYMADHDDSFPHAVDPFDKFAPEIWEEFPEFKQQIPYMPFLHEALQPYIGNKPVFQCASDTGFEVMDNHPWVQLRAFPSMYKTFGTSYAFRTEIAFRNYMQAQFQLPAEVNVLFDGSGHWHGGKRAIRVGDDPETILDLWRGYRYNCLFGDLHAKNVSRDRLQQAWATDL